MDNAFGMNVLESLQDLPKEAPDLVGRVRYTFVDDVAQCSVWAILELDVEHLFGVIALLRRAPLHLHLWVCMGDG